MKSAFVFLVISVVFCTASTPNISPISTVIANILKQGEVHTNHLQQIRQKFIDSINEKIEKTLTDFQKVNILSKAISINDNITAIFTKANEVDANIIKTILSSINDVAQEFLTAVDTVLSEVKSQVQDLKSTINESDSNIKKTIIDN
ncbi:unnamed protein product [Parnassius apollo]|uniref:(apollo) hypothetical protein n=1 Tax=Parnassius apollo TaxID=110799 RepID=A0A8S3XKW2_PARAO|nr:unnamed protein product [Parnassius apollo]